MEWSKDKTMKLIELLQVNTSLWNPSLCDTRREKQKRKEELRIIADILEANVVDVTRKIQHLRTQYNRESAREVNDNSDSAEDRYVSNWYAYEYLHFLKDSSKPYRIFQSEETSDVNNLNPANLSDCKPNKIPKTEPNPVKSEPASTRDHLSIFGEYVANELRSLKCEKDLLVAKKKILDVIFQVKMDRACEASSEPTVCTVYSHVPRISTNSIHSDKVYTSPLSTTQVEPLTATHTTPTTGISEIIINSACHYSNFKVDSQ